ncbi:MAG: adenylate/guanylate cyclase domain-containing protein [Alcanivoracaceae bacterium]|nr:adenylate/guanylate cyclase domain-containing protein [Alcanivoracaceae bacterium]
MDIRDYLRRPDREFWLDLLSPAPQATEAAQQRRQRLTRYALGAANVITLPYIVATALIDPHGTWLLILVNTLSVALFSTGQWMASLGRHNLARAMLMVTMQTQIALLIWLSGPTLNIAVFTFVAAALARVLYTPEEKWQLGIFTAVPFLLLIVAMTLADTTPVDFSQIPPALMAFVRIANAVLCLLAVVLILGVFNREVLRSEADLHAARQRSDNLLHAVLPQSIANELQGGRQTIADHHQDVTVLFADIAGFTPWSARQPPETVVAMLEKVFSRFDQHVTAAGAEKIKTIGDAYMAIAGAPAGCTDHAGRMARLAQTFMQEIGAIRAETGIPLDLRIGLHSGPVIAGVIGRLRFTYDVWGDTVNTASRMESHGTPGKIHISSATRALLEDNFQVIARGVTEIKGKGPMETWWLS